MRYRWLFPWIAMILVNSAPTCWAWLRPIYEDVDVVQRADLIVVGAVERGTLEYVPHPADQQGLRSWEYHLKLTISAVVKGAAKSGKIPVVLDYGLNPSTDRNFNQAPTTRPLPTTAPLAIFDFGSSSFSAEPLIADAMQDNIWLLRADKDGQYHITDPEDLQPLAIKDYFTCYLAKDPESAVRARLQLEPDIAERATRFLTHCDLQRILKEPDPAKRAELLLPYFIDPVYWRGYGEAEDGLIGCGQASGPYLLSAFSTTPEQQIKESIIGIWGKTLYPPGADAMIDMLKQAQRFWAGQTPKQGWWNDTSNSDLCDSRREEYRLTYDAVRALGQYARRDSREIILQTRAFWKTVPFDNDQIVPECDDALAAIAKNSNAGN